MGRQQESDLGAFDEVRSEEIDVCKHAQCEMPEALSGGAEQAGEAKLEGDVGARSV